MSLESELFRGDPKLEEAAVSDPAHILPGAVGPHVGKLQQSLIQLDGARIDSNELESSRYGPSTTAAVLAFKTKRAIINTNYQKDADNIVGKMTMTALDKEMADYEPVVRALEDAIDAASLCAPSDPFALSSLGLGHPAYERRISAFGCALDAYKAKRRA